VKGIILSYATKALPLKSQNVFSESWYFAMQNLANYTVKSIMRPY